MQPSSWAPPPQAQGGAPPGWGPPPPSAQQVYYPPPPAGFAGEMRQRGGSDTGGMESGFSQDAFTKIGTIGFSAVSEKMMGAGHTFVQSLSGSSSALRYYFNVNTRYVRAKLRLLLFPFLQKGHWNRTLEQATGGHKYKPPASDVHAPDLYLPLMGFLTYCLLCCLSDCLSTPSRFKPERLGLFMWRASAAWVLQLALLWAGLRSLASAAAPLHVPLLDLAAYTGYTFVSVAAQCALGLLGQRAYYAGLLWGGLASAVVLVKTMKRVLYAEARSHYGVDPARHNLLLLALALVQLPFAALLGYRPHVA